MRTLIALLISFILIGAAWSAPLPDERERAVYRGEPASYWIGRLKAKDWPTRLDGAHGLREAGPAAWAAVPVLIAALDDPEAEVRLMVIQALGRIGGDAERALPRLEALFGDAKENERLEILRAMLRIDFCSAKTLTIL